MAKTPAPKDTKTANPAASEVVRLSGRSVAKAAKYCEDLAAKVGSAPDRRAAIETAIELGIDVLREKAKLPRDVARG